MAAHLVEEEVDGARLELDVGRHLRRREIDPPGSGIQQGAAEGAFDPRRIEADALALPPASGTHREALPPHGRGEGLDAQGNKILQPFPALAPDFGNRLHAEDASRDHRSARLGSLQIHAAPGLLQPVGNAVLDERRLQIRSQPPKEPHAGLPRLGVEVAGEPDDEEVVGHG